MKHDQIQSTEPDGPSGEAQQTEEQPNEIHQPKENGGPKGPEPTRYGDWERKGRCIDF